MKKPKIHLKDKSISFDDFYIEFESYFIDSHEPRRQKAIRTEYKKITGNEAPEYKEENKKSDEIAGTKNTRRKIKGHNTGDDTAAITEEPKVE